MGESEGPSDPYDELPENVLGYAEAIAALERLIGRRVTASVGWYAGPHVAHIGVGYLQAPDRWGYLRDDEVATYLITEQAEPTRGYHYPLWPTISLHDVPDFVALTNGARVACRFAGVTVTVDLAVPEEWRAAERAHEAERRRAGRG